MNHPIHDDGQLLARFVDRRDERAFEALVQRHAPLVFSVCRRTMGAPADVDDAAQAVFLILAQKAPALRRESSLSTWLHGVAFNVARRARTAAIVRSEKEARAVAERSDFTNDGAWGAVEPLLDGELDALPEKYRTPLVLHHLQGLTEEEIARVLACPVGTVSTQLSRGRSLLRERLTRRGLALTAVAFAGCLSAGRAAAEEVPAGFTAAACSSAKALTIGQPLPAQAQRAAEWAKRYHGPSSASVPTKVALTGTVALVAAVMMALAAGILTQSLSRGSADAPLALETPPPQPEFVEVAHAAKPEPIAALAAVVPPKEEAEPAAAPAAPESDDAKCARWVKELVGPDEKLRATARENLRIAGAPAQAALEAAARGEDQALAEAAQGVLECIKADALLDRMISEAGRADSFQADMSMETKMGMFGFTMSGSIKSTADGKFVSDNQMRFSGLGSMMNNKAPSSIRMVCDGESIWNETRTGNGGKLEVQKLGLCSEQLKARLNEGPLGQIEGLRRGYDFSRVTEGTLDDSPVYILDGEVKKERWKQVQEHLEKEGEEGSESAKQVQKGTPEEKAAGENQKQDFLAAFQDLCAARVYIDKATSYVLKTETMNKKGDVVSSMRLSNVKIGEKLDPNLFQYQPPEGVEVKVLEIPEFILNATGNSIKPAVPPKEHEGF